MNFPIHFYDLLEGRDMGIMQKTFEVGVCGRVCSLFFLLARVSRTVLGGIALPFSGNAWRGGSGDRERRRSLTVCLGGEKEKTHQAQPEQL